MGATSLQGGLEAMLEVIKLISALATITMGKKKTPSCSMLMGFYSFITTLVAVIFGALYFSSTCQIIKGTNNGGRTKDSSKADKSGFSEL